MGERKTLSVPEVARILGVSRNAAYEAAARGELPTVRLGKRILVPRDAFFRQFFGEVPDQNPEAA